MASIDNMSVKLSEVNDTLAVLEMWYSYVGNHYNHPEVDKIWIM